MNLLDYTWIRVKKLDKLEALVKSSQAKYEMERINNKSLQNTITTQLQDIRTLQTLLDIEQNNTRNR